MIGHYLSLIFKGNSIWRWNNFPRVENVSETDNQTLVLHMIVLFDYLLQEKENVKLNMIYIFKKIFFSSLLTFVLSDINSELKRRIKKKNNIVFTKLELHVFNILKSLDIPDRIREDMETYLNSDSNFFGGSLKMENALIKFVTLWIANYEATINAKIYKGNYRLVLKDLKIQLENPDYEIFSKYVDKNVITYLENIRRLQFSRRWNNMTRIFNTTVMSHLYIVFCLSYFIGILENKSDREILQMMKMGLFHDVIEAITGDVLTPTKKSVKGFEEILGDVEIEMLDEYLLVHLEKFELKEKLRELVLNSNDFKGELGKLVKYADHLALILEAKVESRNNDEFNKIYQTRRKMLNRFNVPSIDYLIKFGVDYFDSNFDIFLNTEK